MEGGGQTFCEGIYGRPLNPYVKGHPIKLRDITE